MVSAMNLQATLQDPPVGTPPPLPPLPPPPGKLARRAALAADLAPGALFVITGLALLVAGLFPQTLWLVI